MRLTKEKMRERAEKKLIEYLKENSRVTARGTIVWDKYPICAQDICVLSAVVKDDHVLMTDFDVESETYPESFCRTTAQLDYTSVESIYEQIARYDVKYTMTPNKVKTKKK